MKSKKGKAGKGKAVKQILSDESTLGMLLTNSCNKEESIFLVIAQFLT